MKGVKKQAKPKNVKKSQKQILQQHRGKIAMLMLMLLTATTVFKKKSLQKSEDTILREAIASGPELTQDDFDKIEEDVINLLPPLTNKKFNSHYMKRMSKRRA